MKTLHIIYASTSGHTEYVIDVLQGELQTAGISLTRQIAEKATAEDFAKGDVLLLACGTWNTGSIEGQLNPHMHELLKVRVKDLDLKKKQCTFIALGDERYHYTARAGEHLRAFIETHGGVISHDPLTIVNAPYEQEAKIAKWAVSLISLLS